MNYLDSYTQRIEGTGNIELAESIRTASMNFYSKYLSKFQFNEHQVGLLLGNVQSGKTAHMFGIICEAVQGGFQAFVLLTTDSNVLQQQTLSRAKRDLPEFLICDESDSGLFIENELQKPIVVVLKKNYRILRLWANVFNTTQFMKGNALFIIDDEADAASLNTTVNKNKFSSINRYISRIKDEGLCSIYLQVTGTPQAILLQNENSGFKPNFIDYFTPGKGYLGGDFFFPITGKPDYVEYVDQSEKIIHEVVLRHVAVSAHMLAASGRVSNCLIHPSVRVSEHNKFAQKVQLSLKWCAEHVDDEFQSSMSKMYSTLKPQKHELISEPLFIAKAKELVSAGKIKTLIMNGKHDVSESEYDNGCNFIIGGNTLGRGVTFPALQTICYLRSSKKPNADTMWQHSRMFGYDRDSGLMRLYIPRELYKLFSNINTTNNSIIAQIKQGKIPKIYYPKGINPTRANVLDEHHVDVLMGGTNYYPSNPRNDTVSDITQLLAGFEDSVPDYAVSLRLILQILGHVVPSPDFKMDTIRGVLERMITDDPSAQGKLIVRRNRGVSQGTGALLSANDWKYSNSFSSSVVLTMYQVTGKGWNNKMLWVPNIKLPDGIAYYDEH